MRAGVGRAPGWERRMKARGNWFGLGGMAGLLVGGAAMTAPRGGETFEARVLAEINAARTDPADYAARLRVADGAVGGDDGWSREDRAYDAAARQEAIDFLSHQRPLSALSPSAGLGAAAEQLARQQALDGQVGHASALRERIEGYFKAEKVPVVMRYFDPSYLVRSSPANAEDSILCDLFARHAAHAVEHHDDLLRR